MKEPVAEFIRSAHRAAVSKPPKSYTLGVRMTQADAAALREAAATLGLSVSDLIRPLALRVAAAILGPPETGAALTDSHDWPQLQRVIEGPLRYGVPDESAPAER